MESHNAWRFYELIVCFFSGRLRLIKYSLYVNNTSWINFKTCQQIDYFARKVRKLSSSFLAFSKFLKERKNRGFLKPSSLKFAQRNIFLKFLKIFFFVDYIGFEIETTLSVRRNHICNKILKQNLCSRSKNLEEEFQFHVSELLA